jgi:hypothetical protein
MIPQVLMDAYLMFFSLWLHLCVVTWMLLLEDVGGQRSLGSLLSPQEESHIGLLTVRTRLWGMANSGKLDLSLWGGPCEATGCHSWGGLVHFFPAGIGCRSSKLPLLHCITLFELIASISSSVPSYATDSTA